MATPSEGGLIVPNYGKDDTLPGVTKSGMLIAHNGIIKASNVISGLFEAVGSNSNVNAQTGTTYTLTNDDYARTITATNASAIALTVPLNATLAVPIGFTTEIIQGGAGQVTLTPESGSVVINSKYGKLVTKDLYSKVTLTKTGTNTWYAFGDLGISGGVNAQTSTTYTFALTDAFETVTFGSGSATTATIPAASSVVFPIGTRIFCLQIGAGKTTFAITTDTLNVVAGLAASAQHDGVMLTKYAATTWNIVGLDASTIA